MFQGFLKSQTTRDLAIIGLIIGVCTALLGLVYGVTILQFLINGVITGSLFILGATGLTLIFAIRKFANFSHGDMMTFGAYLAYFINVIVAMNIVWGFVFAAVMTAVLGIIMELLVFRKLAGRGAVSMLVASIGLAIILQNFLNVVYGTSIHTYNIQLASNIVLLVIGGIPVLSINFLRGILPIVVAISMIILLHLLLTRTLLGKAMRATSDNPDLARASGVRVRNVILATWAISGAMSGIAGVLLAIFIDVRPGLGFTILLFIFAAVIVGGLGSPYGAMIGGLIVGIAIELSAAFLAWLGRPEVVALQQPTAYRPIAAFVIMILTLLIRPQGIAGGKAIVLPTGFRRLRLRRRTEAGHRG